MEAGRGRLENLQAWRKEAGVGRGLEEAKQDRGPGGPCWANMGSFAEPIETAHHTVAAVWLCPSQFVENVGFAVGETLFLKEWILSPVLEDT